MEANQGQSLDQGPPPDLGLLDLDLALQDQGPLLYQGPLRGQGHLEVSTQISQLSKLNVSAGSRNCDYKCTNGGGCQVTYVGPPRAGRTQVEFQRKDYSPSSIKHLHNEDHLLIWKKSRVPVSLVTLAAVAAGLQESARIATRLSTAKLVVH